MLLGTTNPAKLRELRALLADFPGRLLSPRDIGTPPDIDETGATFEENAILKARAYSAWSGLPTLADDGGLEIDVLAGEPGVRSRRWIDGCEADDAELIAFALDRMAGIPPERRGARMRVVEALCLPPPGITPTAGAGPAAAPATSSDDEISRFARLSVPAIGSGEIRGRIAEIASVAIDRGFPFRSIFIVDRFEKPYVDLTPAEHAAVVHRADALVPIRRALGLPDRVVRPRTAVRGGVPSRLDEA